MHKLNMTLEPTTPIRTLKLGRLAHVAVMLLTSIMCVVSTGCVFRRMTIRSDPPGALVRLEGEAVGFTPYTTDFDYYGTREITLVKDGYETLTVLQEVPPPWYQRVPLDFFSENLSPVKITNRQEFHYVLQPQLVVPLHELEERANAHRAEAMTGP